jgi:hypothetical protein
MTRARKHIPMIELYAAALAQLLTQDERDALRIRRAPAEDVIRMFTPDHWPILHCFGGPDVWWNLTMRRRSPAVLVKNARDTSTAAKSKRIDKKWNEFTAAMAKGHKPPPRQSRWPKGRKMR